MLVAASATVIATGLIVFIAVEMRHTAEPTENAIVAEAIAKHRTRGDAVSEAQIRDAYETLLHHGLSAEIAAICVAGNWSECSQFKSDEEEAISVAHKIKAPLGFDVSSQELRDSPTKHSSPTAHLPSRLGNA